MNFAVLRPWMLLLIPVMVAFVIVIGIKLRTHSQVKKIKYIIYRCLVFVLLALALSGISVQWMSKEVTTIFLVDLSDSTIACQKDMEMYVRKAIADMPKNNKAGIVAFGSDAVVETFVSDAKTFTEFDVRPISTATNLENAVTDAVALFPEESAKRLVLITDGSENEGSLSDVESLVISKDINCMAIKVSNELEKEVYISDLEIPDKIHVGDEFSVKATINSTVTSNAVVSLYSGRSLKSQENVKLQVGENQFVFKDVGIENGMQSYRVTVEPDQDTITANNEYCAFTQVESQPRLLVIEGQSGEGDEFAKMLDAAGYAYDKVTPSGVPNNINDLNQYKSVIMINVFYPDLRKGFPAILQTYVKDYAGGFICIGGEDSYALGGYRSKELEEILPVNMDLEGQDKVPKMSLYMVIDHSGSMSTPVNENSSSSVTCLDMAKQAAVAGLDSLRPTDEIGVMSFDDSYQWVVAPQLAENRDDLEVSISTIGEGGGTNIHGALQAAVKRLAESDSEVKHIILLTDGEDYNDYTKLKDDINDLGITLSTVSVGPEADSKTLKDLAEHCGGRFYACDVANGIPRIFAQEVFLSFDSYLRNDPFTPVITNHHEILGDLFDSGYPMLNGYIASSLKSTATSILQSEEGDPILTVWQYGLGKSVAWNSDGSNQWTGDWAKWSNYTDFWSNVIDYTLSDTSLGEDSLEVVQAGSKAKVSYGTKEFDSNTKVTGVCTDEQGNTKEVTFNPVAPGRYEADIDMTEIGVYSINIRNQSGEEVVKTVNTAAALQYSPEYNLDNNKDVLDSFIETVDGKMITMEDNVFTEQIKTIRGRKNLTNFFLVLALILFMVEVVVRRLNIDVIEKISASIVRRREAKKELRREAKENVLRKGKTSSAGTSVNAANTASTGRANATGKMDAEVKTTGETATDNGVKKSENKTTAKKSAGRKIEKKKTSRKPEQQAMDMSALLQKKKDRDGDL